MKFRRSTDHVLQTDVDGGIALLDPQTNSYYLLNGTGAVIWDALDAECSVDEICALVASRFRVSEERCKSDVENLISSMTKKGFVVPSNESAE